MKQVTIIGFWLGLLCASVPLLMFGFGRVSQDQLKSQFEQARAAARLAAHSNTDGAAAFSVDTAGPTAPSPDTAAQILPAHTDNSVATFARRGREPSSGFRPDHRQRARNSSRPGSPGAFSGSSDSRTAAAAANPAGQTPQETDSAANRDDSQPDEPGLPGSGEGETTPDDSSAAQPPAGSTTWHTAVSGASISTARRKTSRSHAGPGSADGAAVEEPVLVGPATGDRMDRAAVVRAAVVRAARVQQSAPPLSDDRDETDLASGRNPTDSRSLLWLSIPRIGVNAVVLGDVSTTSLAKGPGHYPNTDPPGFVGNCVIAAHRNMWGDWFDHLDRLRPGDEVVLETLDHRYVYRVTGSHTITPWNTSVLRRHGHKRELTLITCTHPATHRVVVDTVLDHASAIW